MRRSGFTLIEVLVSVVVASLVIMGAYRIQAGVLDAMATTAETRRRLASDANARWLLASAAGAIDMSTLSEPFDGAEHAVSFSTWTSLRHPWPERNRVTLERQGDRLVIAGLGAPLPLADSVTALDVDYLSTFGFSARWMRVWTSSLSAPVAIRLRVQRVGRADTLLLLVGVRG